MAQTLVTSMPSAHDTTGTACTHGLASPSKKHHRGDRFQNNYLETADKPLADVAKWTLERLRLGLPKPPEVPTPTVAPDLKFVSANNGANQQPAITWVGHATMLVQMGGMNVLTDPVFSNRVSPVQFAGPKRHHPPGIALADLPHIDVVLISHNHYDHLDLASVQALAKQANGSPLFLVPLGVKAWMMDASITHVRELDWYECVTPTLVASHTSLPPVGAGAALGRPGDGAVTPMLVASHTSLPPVGAGAVEFHFTPVQHWSARGLGDRRATLWGGWAVLAPDFHMYFSGDTGYSADFADTERHFAARQTPDSGGGFDIAMLAVGAYEPRWFMKEQHINPAEAVQIHRDLRAKKSVGVHWGTFDLTDESLDQPPKDLALARIAQGVKEDDFFLLAIGETRKLARRAPKR